MGRAAVLSTFLFVSLALATVASGASAVDQQGPSIDPTIPFTLAVGSNSHQMLAQVFTAGATGALTRVDLPVSCSANTDLIVEIQGVTPNADGGAPNGVVLASQVTPYPSLGSFYNTDFRAIAFGTPAFVNAGTAYAIVMYVTNPSASRSCGVLPAPAGDPYAGGQAWFDAAPNPPGWKCKCEFPGTDFDLPFRTYVDQSATPPPAVDLSLSIQASAGGVRSWGPLVYTLVVTNNSATPATNVLVTDITPPGASVTALGAGCTVNGDTVTCGAASVAGGASAIFQFTVSAPIVSGAVPPVQTFTNTAAVSANEGDPNTANNHDSKTTNVFPSTDLVVSKSAPTFASTGEVVTYTITVINLGPSDGTNVMLLDPLPAGTTFSAITSSDASAICGQALPTDPHPGDYGCRFPSLPSGGSADIQLTVMVTATGPYTITNTATAYAGIAASTADVDPDTSNNSSTANVTLTAPSADVAVFMSASAPVIAGQTLTYSFQVSNFGLSDASNVTLIDALPAGAVVLSMSAQCVNTAGTLTCPFGTLLKNANVFPQITIQVPNTPGATLTNSASVTASEPDPFVANNTASVSQTITSLTADLKLTKTVSATTVNHNDTLTYTIRAKNLGPDLMSNVTITDTLPSGMTLVSATWVKNIRSGPCTTPSPGTIVCVSPTAQGIGVDMVAAITVSASTVGTFTNAATGSANESDPDLTNNTASATVTVRGNVDLSVTMTDVTTAPHVQGAAIAYRIDVTNTGPDAASDVVVTDTLPAGVSYAGGTVGCSASGAVVTCALGTMAPAATSSLFVFVNLNTTGPITNTATVATTDHDTNASNDTASASATIFASTDLAIAQTATPGAFAQVTFTATITNNGPSASNNAAALAPLPAGTTFVSLRSPGAVVCAQQAAGQLYAGQYGCRFGTIPVGGTVTMTLVVQLMPAVTATSATTTIRYDGTTDYDPVSGNDSVTTPYDMGPTPPGTNVATQPIDRTTGTQPIDVTFSTVTGAGETTLSTSTSGPTPPPGFTGFLFNGTYFDLHTTASYSGTIRVCVSDPSITTSSRFLHYEAGAWVDRTVLPVTPPMICAEVTSFSPFAVFRDDAAPVVTITAPTATTYTIGQHVAASYGCTDAGTGVASCAGTVANGADIDTATIGAKTFRVDARDNAGNRSSATLTYEVGYGICLLPPDKNDSAQVRRVAFRLCDAAASNLSSAGLRVSAVSLDGSPLQPIGHSPLQTDFRYDPSLAAYALEVSLQGVTPGSHVLRIAVAGETTHELVLVVK